ncbi:oligopeptide/dipeptide ABC transporter ATP-binding protein [Streptomyces sp. NPDC096132]|uniref:oligopeptide/dipeptide ABC transporter ATP-binding protein n=1 Tax=Streptomyces sp. NPDC096132 TaxID=3366075 RepID=UPI00380CD727
MYAGQVVERGEVEQVLTSPAHPYTRALRAASPEHAVHGTFLTTVPGTVPPLGKWPTGCRFADRCPYATAACEQQAPHLHSGRDDFLPGIRPRRHRPVRGEPARADAKARPYPGRGRPPDLSPGRHDPDPYRLDRLPPRTGIPPDLLTTAAMPSARGADTACDGSRR